MTFSPSFASGYPLFLRGGCFLTVILALTPFPGLGQDLPRSADFEEVYRIGGASAPEWAQFGMPGYAAFDDSGTLYILEPSRPVVVAVASDGTLLRMLGGRGEGPGEFTAPTHLLVWRDGRLGVMDLGKSGFQIFGPDGAFRRTVRLGGSANIAAALNRATSPMKPDPTSLAVIAQGASHELKGILGTVAAQVNTTISEAPADARGLDHLDLSEGVATAEGILQAWGPPRDETISPTLADLSDPARIAEIMLAGEVLYEPGFLWDVLPDGSIAYTDSSTYVVKIAGSSPFLVGSRSCA